MARNYPLPIAACYQRLDEAKRRSATCSQIIALTIALVLLAMLSTVTMGCNQAADGNSQASATKSPKPEKPGASTSRGAFRPSDEARRHPSYGSERSERFHPTPFRKESMLLPNLQEEQETADITDSDIEAMEQNGRLTNKETKKAFSLINSLKRFIPSSNHTGTPLRSGENDVSPSLNKSRRLAKSTRSESDIVSRASKIAENVGGVGKNDPFEPPRGMGDYQIPNLDAHTINPVAKPDKSKAYKQKSIAIQLKGIAISKQPAAILEIDGISHIVSQGDVIADMKVMGIREDEVILDRNGKKYKLSWPSNLTLSQ